MTSKSLQIYSIQTFFPSRVESRCSSLVGIRPFRLELLLEVLSHGTVYYAVPLSVTIQLKANEQHFTVVLFIIFCTVVLTFECGNTILMCDHSNES